MLNWMLDLPMALRLTLVFLIGVWIGGAVNWAIYRLAWNARPISPWSPPYRAAPTRRWWYRLPVIGWLGLRRESPLHGRGFWIRPLFLELATGIGLAALYWWEIDAAGLLPPEAAGPLPLGLLAAMHQMFAAHVVLIALMLAASMIDVDEKTIPDEITIPGTLIGLLMAAAWPLSRLPNFAQPPPGFSLHITSPWPWPEVLDGAPNASSLLLGLACWWLWSVAILPRSWYARHGWLRAAALCWARVTREQSTYRILRMAVMGSLAIALVWYRGGLGWESALSALVGMAASGGLVWSVRVIGTTALGREAMGFGDVTLMAMMGAYLGWQPCLMIFFLAPFAGLAIGVLRLILWRDKEIPFGPFLCLAALFLIVCWEPIWNYALAIFAMGWLVPAFVFGSLLLMGAMLAGWRLLIGLLVRRRP